MKEIEKLTVELLYELEGMSPEMIEDIRFEWIEDLKARDAERFPRVELFVNDVCSAVIARAKKQLEGGVVAC